MDNDEQENNLLTCSKEELAATMVDRLLNERGRELYNIGAGLRAWAEAIQVLSDELVTLDVDTHGRGGERATDCINTIKASFDFWNDRLCKANWLLNTLPAEVRRTYNKFLGKTDAENVGYAVAAKQEEAADEDHAESEPCAGNPTQADHED